jgi:hypothetical protein
VTQTVRIDADRAGKFFDHNRRRGSFLHALVLSAAVRANSCRLIA